LLPVPQTPVNFTVPKGACDCHVHVFGPSNQYPYAQSRAYTPSDASETQLGNLHQQIGIERLVIVHPSPYGSDNQRTTDGIKFFGEKARGVAVINELTTSFQDIELLMREVLEEFV
jgi:predicted TIM-barrel fold metal-dependent hydrolase